jgi:hypothetical protein
MGIATKALRVIACLVAVPVVGAGCLAAGWGVSGFLHKKISHPERASAQAIASRFPEARDRLAVARPAVAAAALKTVKDQQLAFAAAAPSDALKPINASLTVAMASPAAQPVPDAVKPAAVRRNRPNALLDDAQIAGIKKRLNLTPKQERMWPAVEAALRDIAVAQPEQPKSSKPSRKAPATIELSSADLTKLKTAAEPLILSFNDDQKDELRTLARLTGLEKFAP